MESLTTYVQSVAPNGDGLLGLAAVLIVAATLAGLGAGPGGRTRLPEADLVCGWGIVCLVFTVAGVLTPIPFTALTVATLALAAMSLCYARLRDGRFAAPGTGRTLLLVAPLLLLLAGMTPSQWDEFSQWLPSARYLVEIDAFPGGGRPASAAHFPAYPYGVPLVTYLASRLAGRLVENTGALFNVIALVAFGLLMVRVIRNGLALPQDGPIGWGWCAVAVLSVTLLNPAFVQKILLTQYADYPSAIGVGFAGVLAWLLLEALAEGDQAAARSRAFQLGLTLAFVVNAKQANLVHAVVLLAGLAVVALRDPRVPFARMLRLTPLVIVPAGAVYVAWQWYVAAELPGGGQVFLPRGAWNVGLMPEILKGMLNVATKKGAYFGLMAVAVVFAVRGLVRMRDPIDRLAVITAVAFLGYNLFLFIIYVTVYDPASARAVGWYWRFNLHLGLLAVAFGGYGGALLWRHLVRQRLSDPTIARVGRVAAAAVLVLPIAFAFKLRFDVHPVKDYVKAVAAEMATLMPPGSSLVVVDPLDTGFYTLMVAYRLYGVAEMAAHASVYSFNTAETLARMIENRKPSHIWVHTQNAAVRPALGLALDERASHLLARAGTGWRLVQSWPYPGYRLPQDVED